MEYKNGYINFYTLTVGELLNLDNGEEQLIVNGFIFFPNTYIRELKTAELQCLFDEDTFEDVVKKYPYHKHKEVRYDIQQRLNQYAKNGSCVMYINKKWIILITRDSVHHIERTNFDSAIRTLTGSEIIV